MTRFTLPFRSCLAAFLLGCFGLLPGCGGGGTQQPVTPPPPPPPFSYNKPADLADGWTVTAATDLGVDVVMLETLVERLPDEFDIVDSLAIAYQGQLIFDETFRTSLNDFDLWVDNENLDMHVMFSASKSLASLAVGIAIDQGVFAGVDVPFLSLFDYDSYQNADPRKDDILLEDVLTMRLGLDWNEYDPPYTSPDNQMLRFYQTETDFSKSLLDLPMVADPGTVFSYNTPAIVSLGQAIENRAPLSLIDFGLNYALLPLDIVDVEVFRTPTGLPDLGRGLFLTTRDFLKFGQLYANGGTWNGERIVSEAWINASVVPYSEFGWLEPENFDWQVSGYGYQWWTGYFEVDGRRIEAYAARGHGEQNLLVVPELELVVAVFSHAFNSEADEINQTYALIANYIIPALP